MAGKLKLVNVSVVTVKIYAYHLSKNKSACISKYMRNAQSVNITSPSVFFSDSSKSPMVTDRSSYGKGEFERAKNNATSKELNQAQCLT